MEKRMMQLVGVLVLICLCGSATLALDPLGPPVARVKAGQWSVGIDYLWEDSDIELDDALPAGFTAPFKMNVKEQLVTANLAYGIVDNWEIFVRLGAETSGEGDGEMSGDEVTFEGDSGCVAGLGVKASFYEQGNLKLGGLFQVSWGRSEGEIETQRFSGSVDGETTEIGMALGPIYKLTERVSIYGGPFLYFIDGSVDGDVSIINVSYEIDEADYFGGYIGSQIDITDSAALNIEWQHTASADGLGMGLVWKF